MKVLRITTALGLVSNTLATGPIPVSRSGLAGIDGFTFYDPYCAHGCFRSFSPFTLPCSSMISAGGHTTGAEAARHLALCRSSSFPYLSSIAWCVHLYCPANVKASTIEKFWETQIMGDVNILPTWTYGETLANITEPPTMLADPMDKDLVLNMTMLTTEDNWKITTQTLVYFFRETAIESYYGLSICLTAFALPIVLTWLQYLPYMTRVLHRIRPWILPSIIGTYHDRPLPHLLGNAPTIGQSGYIAVVVTLNIIFLAVGYKTLYPRNVMQWYENRYQELMAYFMWRTGVLAFCNMPVLFLFSSRNNILLWLTNWSHSTYMLLHRWIARLFLLQTLLHSVLALVLYKSTGYYDSSLSLKWWIWGVVATVAAVILVLTSLLVFRQRNYELFLITHIVMAVICVVGCWYHVWYGYENCFGYETWLYATVAVWFFDRLARVGRIIKVGIRRAQVTDIGPSIARIDLPGVRWTAPGHCVYVFFPTLNAQRPWENHPFSMIPTAVLANPTLADRADSEIESIEKNQITVLRTAETQINATSTSGVTLFIRKRAGMTGSLRAGAGLLTLLEGPYPTLPSRSLLKSDRLILIGGGIGITGLVPFLRCHPNVKLFHSLKSVDRCLVEALNPLLNHIKEKHIVVGERLKIADLLRSEVDLGYSTIGVVVCGPAGMCDDVRAIVAGLGREKAGKCTLELEVDAFSW